MPACLQEHQSRETLLEVWNEYSQINCPLCSDRLQISDCIGPVHQQYICMGQIQRLYGTSTEYSTFVWGKYNSRMEAMQLIEVSWGPVKENTIISFGFGAQTIIYEICIFCVIFLVGSTLVPIIHRMHRYWGWNLYPFVSIFQL